MDKQIQFYFFKSIGIINKNIFLVLILSALPIFNLPKASAELIILQLLGLMLVTPLIYGRFYESASNENKSTWSQIFKTPWLNYTLVMFILLIPLMAINQLDIENKFAASMLSVVILIITIYVVPLVFITKKRISPITSGIKCLVENLRYSIPFIVIALAMSITGYLEQTYILTSLQNNTEAFYAVAFPCNMIKFYIGIAVFITLIMLLIENEKFKKYLNAET